VGRTHDVTISAFDLDRFESELAAVTEQRDRLAEAGKILAEEYEDRRSQWGGEYLWQKYEDAQRVDAAIAVFTAAVEGGSHDKQTTKDETEDGSPKVGTPPRRRERRGR
jgi:hypothetical protein